MHNSHAEPMSRLCFFSQSELFFETFSSSQDQRSGESTLLSNVICVWLIDTMVYVWVEFLGPLLSSESFFFGCFGFAISLELKPNPSLK